MYKNFMLKCQVYNDYNGYYQDKEYYFETKEEMINFVKIEMKKREPIIITVAFKLEKMDNDIFVFKKSQIEVVNEIQVKESSV